MSKGQKKRGAALAEARELSRPQKKELKAMNNSITESEIVKCSQQKIFDLMHYFMSSSPYWKEDENRRIIPHSLIRPDEKIHGIVTDSLYLYSKKAAERKKGTDIYARLQWVRNTLKHRNLTKIELLKAMAECKNHVSTLCTAGYDGKFSVYEGYARGTERYNKKQMATHLERAKYMYSQDRVCVFLTLTCDTKAYASRYDAWANYYKNEIRPFHKALNKMTSCFYDSVTESTANGYPHIHMVLSFPKGMFPEIEKLKNKTKIRYGKLFNFVKSHAKSPVFQLERARGENLKWYLVKYIAKGIDESPYKIMTKGIDFTKSEIKLLQEHIYMTATRQRKSRGSRLPKSEREIMQERQAAAYQFKSKKERTGWRYRLDACKDDLSTATKWLGFLTSTCTNCPRKLDYAIYSMNYNDYEGVFHSSDYRDNSPDKEKIDKFKAHSKVLYDATNFIQDYMDFVCNPVNSKLNKKVYMYEDSSESRSLIDGFDLNDPISKTRCFLFVWEYYAKSILEDGFSYMAVLNNKQHVTDRLKVRKTGHMRYEAKWDENPNLCYYKIDEWTDTSKKLNLSERPEK